MASPQNSNGHLACLPTELINAITSYLPNRDIKNLRLASTFCHYVTPLRLSRVFLSANPRNIEVLRAVADHETLRKGVVEIIWDDTYLTEDLSLQHEQDTYNNYHSSRSSHPDPPVGCPEWYQRQCEDNIKKLASRKDKDASRPDHVARAHQLAAELSLEESYTYYQDLVRQQTEVIASGADEEAFRYGVERFPSLTRVTITPESHGWLFMPLYETPMIRSFPYGFNYPIPRGRQTPSDHQELAEPWQDNSGGWGNRWRGFRLAISVLAQHEQHHVSELIIGGRNVCSGLNCRLFDGPSKGYDNLVSLLRRPGFRRIDLSLVTGGQVSPKHFWSAFRNGHLRKALAEATDLEHVSLASDRTLRTLPGQYAMHFIPLRTIFPAEQWPRLRHFGLSSFLVQQEDLFSFVASLPSLRSIDLRFLSFTKDIGVSRERAFDTDNNYRDLLIYMRDALGWRDRPVRERPKVSIVVQKTLPLVGRGVWLDREIEEFLYGNGPFCTQILSDYGASVVKVEQPGVGDETRHWRASDEAQLWKDDHKLMSLYFSAVNRNKRSLTLNLKSPQGVEVAKRLARQSDVLIHNFVPGTAEAMGLGYEDLEKENKRLIYASVSGYGASGPNRARAGYDGIALAEAGLLHITGEPDGRPTKPGVAIADMCTGLYTHGAILAALVQRERTGRGIKIEGSLFETGLSMLINVGLNALNLDTEKGHDGRRRGQRWGLQHPSLAPYGAFETKDKKFIFVAANNNRQWRLLCEKLKLHQLSQDERFQTNDGRLQNRGEINSSLQTTIGQRTKAEWMSLLDGSGLPYGAINDVVEALEHPQSVAREMVMDVTNVEAARDGCLKLIAPAIKFEGKKLGVRMRPPLLGQHTSETLEELGYTDAEIADMRESGAI
ncbi:Succinate--hydroxymethylglutarate -transferase [Fusarium albosuccineum]|uniref:Succinate--hydroxymethylglutarate -transferase n=1 Tax=Fusarium albosuccineum TaxID=1237068 RepID=A0A8H4KZS2_9HYPO|nr:Succinate--hydroxymethylglutarate -transferase [Fusarium albosuccineum]